jgi:hypothetical protein
MWIFGKGTGVLLRKKNGLCSRFLFEKNEVGEEGVSLHRINFKPKLRPLHYGRKPHAPCRNFSRVC